MRILLLAVVGFALLAGSALSRPPVRECADTLDNDADGLADWPADPGCANQKDRDETNAPTTEVVFADEFNGTGPPDPAKWWATPWCSTSYNDKEVCFNPANAYQEGGNLVLKVSAGTGGRPYDAGQVQTFVESGWPPTQVKAQLSAPVRVEARIRFAPGAGMWGAFWLMSNTNTAGNLELDVQEFRGLYPNQVTCHTHGLKEFGATIVTPYDGSADFHVYWTEYRANHVRFGVDTQVCGETTLPSAPNQMIRLTNVVGPRDGWGGVGGPPPASAIPAFMYVDWVRARTI